MRFPFIEFMPENRSAGKVMHENKRKDKKEKLKMNKTKMNEKEPNMVDAMKTAHIMLFRAFTCTH